MRRTLAAYLGLAVRMLVALVLLTSSVAQARSPSSDDDFDVDEPRQPVETARTPGRFAVGLGTSPLLLLKPGDALSYKVGVTVKFVPTRSLPLAIQALGGAGAGRVPLNVDVLYISRPMKAHPWYDFAWHVGGGAGLGVGRTCHFDGCSSLSYVAGHAVLGMGLQFKSAPAEVTLEWRPSFLTAWPGGRSSWGVHLLSSLCAFRYYFF